MNGENILKAITYMATTDNKGLQMSTTVLNACTKDEISQVTFQTSREVTSSAGLQAVGLRNDYMCCAFFIKRDELARVAKELALK